MFQFLRDLLTWSRGLRDPSRISWDSGGFWGIFWPAQEVLGILQGVSWDSRGSLKDFIRFWGIFWPVQEVWGILEGFHGILRYYWRFWRIFWSEGDFWGILEGFSWDSNGSFMIFFGWWGIMRILRNLLTCWRGLRDPWRVFVGFWGIFWPAEGFSRVLWRFSWDSGGSLRITLGFQLNLG